MDALNRSMLHTMDCVTAPVTASTGTTESVLASAGLTEPPALASSIVESPEVAPASPIDGIDVVPTSCSTECAAQAVPASTLLPWVSVSSSSPATFEDNDDNDMVGTKLVPDNNTSEHLALLESSSFSSWQSIQAQVPKLLVVPSASTATADNIGGVVLDTSCGGVVKVPVTCSMKVLDQLMDVASEGISAIAATGPWLCLSASPPLHSKLVVHASTTSTFQANIRDTSVIINSSIRDVPLAAEETLLSYQVPWPPPYLYLSWCDKSKSRPTPWPSFAEVPGGVHLTEPRPLLQESVEGILSLIRRGASLFKLWHIPWFSFLFTGLTSEERYGLALLQWEIAWQLYGECFDVSIAWQLEGSEKSASHNLIIEAKKVLITWSLTNMSCCNTTTVHASTGTMDVELRFRYQMAMGMEVLDRQQLRGFSILVVSVYNTLVAETVITEFQLPNLLYHHQASKIRPVPMVELQGPAYRSFSQGPINPFSQWLPSLVQLNYRVQDLGLGSVCKLSGNITKSGILLSWLPQAKPPDGTTGLMNQHSRLRFVLVGVSIAAAKLVSWFIGHINQCGFGLPNWKTAWSRQWGCSEMVAWLVLVTRFRPENHDKYILILMKIQHRIFVSLYCVSKSLQLSAAPFELYVTFLPVEMDPTSTEAWEQGVCVLQSGCNPNWQLPTAPFLNVQQLLGCPSLIGSDFIQGVPCDYGFSAAACALYALDQFLVAFSTSSEIVFVYHMLHSSFSWLGEAQLSFYEHDTDTCTREPIQAANDENHGCTRSQAISGMTPSTRYNQAPFQEGRDVMFVTAVLVKDSVDLEYHLAFGWDYADDCYALDWISIHRNYFYLAEEYSNFDYHRDSDNIQELRVHWDPGGCWWCRLGVKPSFKKGGMLGAYCTWAYLLRPAHGPGLAVRHPSEAG